RGPVDPAKRYYAFKLLLAPQVAGGAACDGCDAPVRIALENIQLFQPPELSHDPILTTPIGRSVVYWQAQVGGVPQLTAFDPPAGAAGDVVSIRGRNFDGATAVRFAGQDAAFEVVTDSLIHATVPVSAHRGPIEVWSPFGITSLPTEFIAAPVVESFL